MQDYEMLVAAGVIAFELVEVFDVAHGFEGYMANTFLNIFKDSGKKELNSSNLGKKAFRDAKYHLVVEPKDDRFVRLLFKLPLSRYFEKKVKNNLKDMTFNNNPALEAIYS